MSKLYVSNRFSLHMLNDIVLLRRNGELKITPIALDEAKKLLNETAEEDTYHIDTIVEDVLEHVFDERNLVNNIRINEDDTLLVVLVHGRGGEPKMYRVEY